MKLRQLVLTLLAISPACAVQPDDVDHTGDGDGKADGTSGSVRITGTGFAAQAGADVNFAFVYSNQPGMARDTFSYRSEIPKVDATGAIAIDRPRANAKAFKLLVFINVDGVAGCSAADYLASVQAPAGGGDAVLEISPTQLPKIEDESQELLDCNQAFAPRYDATVSISGLTAADGQRMNVFSLPHPGYSNVTKTGAVVEAGAASVVAAKTLTSGFREKLVVYIEKDGQPGCSDNDIIAAVTVDPATGPKQFPLVQSNLPRSADPAQDLHDCNKFKGPAGTGDYDLVVRGSGFESLDGKQAKLGSFKAALQTATVASGAFEVVLPNYLWEAEDEGVVLLLDGNGDSRCGDASDRSGTMSVGHVTADHIINVTPDTLQSPLPDCW
ncbi:MAG: hypothetical protein AB7O24_07250 [Kofleriaceae bacterium]